MKKFLLLALSLMCVLIAVAAVVVFRFPAESAWRRVGERAEPLRLQGLAGTVWSGSAAQLSMEGESLGKLVWSLDKWPLLSRRLQGDLQLEGREIEARAALAADAGEIRLERLSARFPAARLNPALDIPSLNLLGTVDLEFSRLSLREGLVHDVDGELVWRDAGVSGSAEARFSGVKVHFTREGEAIIGRIGDLGGPLAAKGRIELRGVRFTADIELSARDGDARTLEALRYVGERLPDGSSLLRIEGSIRKLL